MGTTDFWATIEAELKAQRHQIIEQAGCPMIRFMADGYTCILPYSELTRAECHIHDDHYQIRATWPRFIVTVEGYHLDHLIQCLAEHRLNSVILRSDIEEERREGHPYLERIGFASVEAVTTSVNLR